MNKVIDVTDLQRNFRAVLDDVVQRKISYVLTRDSRAEAVMVPYEQWLQYEAARKEQLLTRFDQMLEEMTRRNARYSDEEVEADVEAAIRQVRARAGDAACVVTGDRDLLDLGVFETVRFVSLRDFIERFE